MNQVSSFYLVSTPLHLVVASAVALSKRRFESAVLLFVAQETDNQRMNFFREAIVNWKASPFEDVYHFFRPEGSFIQKISQRKSVFKQLENLVGERKPSVVYVGNDRQFEFQWSMHCARQQWPEVKGVYLDEGLYSYLGRNASKRFSERWIDNALKKWVYGNWYQSPPTIGGSEYVDEVMVAFPDCVFAELKQTKQIVAFNEGIFQQPELRALARNWLKDLGIDSAVLSQARVVLTLPEKSDMMQVDGYVERAQLLVEQLASLDQKVVVKYHPKDLNNDLLGVAHLENVQMVPANAPFEILIQSLSANTFVLGDMSSTVLTARLFRNDLNVMVMRLNDKASYFDHFAGLFQQLGLPICSPDNIVERVHSDSPLS